MRLTPEWITLVRGEGGDWRREVRKWCEQLFGIRHLEFAYKEYGKPYFRNFPELEFSVTHTRDSMCAVFSRQEVGVDAEFRDRPTRALRLADRYFQPAEAAWLRRRPETEQGESFLNLWTAKEACVKLTGEGIYRGLSKCHLETSTRPTRAALSGRPAFLKPHVWEDGLIVTVAAWSEFQLECLEH